MQNEKSEQVIAVTGVRTVSPVRIFLADETRLFEVLDGSADSLFGDTEILGDPFYAGPRLLGDITAVIKVDVDELRPMGKLVISIQFFKVGHLFTSYADVRTGVWRRRSTTSSMVTLPPWALLEGSSGGLVFGNALSTAATMVFLQA